jgi:hypothetical protein
MDQIVYILAIIPEDFKLLDWNQNKK